MPQSESRTQSGRIGRILRLGWPPALSIDLLDQRITSTEMAVAGIQRELEDSKLRADRLASELHALTLAHQTLAERLVEVRNHVLKGDEALAHKIDAMGFAAGLGDPKMAPARPVVELVEELRAEAARLFSDSEPGIGGATVEVTGLDVELRGDFALEEKIVGIRPFAPGRAGPESASTIRFALRPILHIATEASSEKP
jgi:hypothetical protein